METKENATVYTSKSKRRLFAISLLSIIVAIATSFIARLLVSLIDFFTNLSFYGTFSWNHASPASNSLGIYVVFVPMVGGLIVGLMAGYGSKAIRGHGIPEAMEQILTNQSKIKPAITILKPLSAAISIGTGGPFGAEGPIISTGGAMGSTIGQLLKITHYERKIVLTAGATAGMSAIFGSPLAAIFLAIELLLFEFSPRSIIPIALACVTGAAGHHFLFEPGPVFPFTHAIAPASNLALGIYSLIGLLVGFASVLVTKSVYLIEDGFGKLPIHWMWWPALGGVFVGLIGFFAPRTLGVGYNNIIDLLSGDLPLKVVIFLCVLKLISWAIALGSGTSGGTLAPLLTIGGATGTIVGSIIIYVFPTSGIILPIAALVGMSAMFAGASRAVLTSIIFGLETTGQFNALLPLLAACCASYFVSFFVMKNTIMTEKIARRGIKTPHSYESDMLDQILVSQVMKSKEGILNHDETIHEAREKLNKISSYPGHDLVVRGMDNQFIGIIPYRTLLETPKPPQSRLSTLALDSGISIKMDQSLRIAADLMAREDMYVLAVISNLDNRLVGVVTYKDVIDAQAGKDHVTPGRSISLRRNAMKIVIQGRKLTNRKRH